MDALGGGGHDPDLRKVGTHPDYWYPIAHAGDVQAGKIRGVSFAGEPIVLARPRDGALFALEDRCAHRQVPLHAGVLEGRHLRCGYHGWTYDASGACVNVPYLSGERSLPNGVRSYPCREAYGLVFVFPGDPAQAATVPFPAVPAHGDPAYKTRELSRRIDCHYTFMHENLMDMNHQFLHRTLMGGIRPTLLRTDHGDDWMEAVYTFARVSGTQSLGERFMLGQRAGEEKRREHDEMVIRTQYPYQTLTFTRADGDKPVLDLWLAYVPVDREQKCTHSFGLMSIKRPPIPGLIHLLWPFIVWFTNGIFAQDQWIMEEEQKAHDAQGDDWNHEIFPVIQGLRAVLARRGKPLG